MKYKALMLDVDGTTVPNKREGMPSVRVKAAIKKAQNLLHVGVVTGRPYCNVEHIINDLGLSGPSILSGGGQIITAETNTVLWEKTISMDIIKQIHKIIPHYTILLTDGANELTYSDNLSLLNTLDAGVQGIPQKEAEKVIAAISHISTLAIHTVPSWKTGNVDVLINHVAATKHHGIFEVAKLLGIETHEIIGVGDGGNDMPLLMACGLKVAMGNAHEGLKAIADYVAPSVDEDGVADVIEKFILKK